MHLLFLLEKNKVYLGVKHYYVIEFSQKPLELKRFISKVLDEKDDITRFEYIKKTNKDYGDVLLGIQLQNYNNLKYLIDKMDKSEFSYQKINENDLIYSYLV